MSKLVKIPGIVVAASGIKSKATKISIQCRSCRTVVPNIEVRPGNLKIFCSVCYSLLTHDIYLNITCEIWLNKDYIHYYCKQGRTLLNFIILTLEFLYREVGDEQTIILSLW